MKTTFLAALAALALAAPAAASPCGERIAALEKRAGAAASPDLQGTAPETTGALLHHQPTVGAVAGAERSADSPESVRTAKFQVDIEQARAADDSGDAKECEASANEAQKQLP
jgi:hypothetical protein